MIMSGPQRLSAEAYATELLRNEPDLDFQAVRERARGDGISVLPIHYGRARKQLGLPVLRDVRPTAKPQPAAESLDAPGYDHDAPTATPSRATDEAKAAPAAAADDEPAADPAADLVAPRKRGSPAFDFLVQQLRNEPQALYADLRDRCAAKGFQIAPIMYGRAKAVLGLVPVKPRGKKAAGGSTPTRPSMGGAPLQLKQVESVAADRFSKKLEEVRSLEQLVAIVKDLDAERRRLRSLLEKVVTMIDEALDG